MSLCGLDATYNILYFFVSSLFLTSLLCLFEYFLLQTMCV
jgi:hypothetical protein